MYNGEMAAVLTDEITAHLNYLYTFAFRLTGDSHDAEDLAQEAALKALEKIDTLNDKTALKSWLRKITVNIYLQKERRKGIVNIQTDETLIKQTKTSSFSPEETVLIDETVQEIQDTCFTVMAAKLTLPQKIVFVTVDIFGAEMKETAELLGLSEQAGKALLHRARRNLLIFFRQNCQLLFSDLTGKCTCESWKKVLEERGSLKKAVTKEHSSPPFDNPEYLDTELDVSAARILTLFHSMPPRKPDIRWYAAVTEEIKAFKRIVSVKKTF